MKIQRHQRGEAQIIDSVLGALARQRSIKQIAQSCSVSNPTVKSWRLSSNELAIPHALTRKKLAAIVEKYIDKGARTSLEIAWSILTDDSSDPMSGSNEELLENENSQVELTLAQRLKIVQQAIIILEQAYAHLRFKRARHAIDPIQRLRLIEYKLSVSEAMLASEVSFHREMIDIFTSNRDLHTTYVAPDRYQRAALTLPFIVEEFFDVAPNTGLQAIYVASKVEEDFGEFKNGVRITHWNAVPIARAIELLGEKQAAGNLPAAHARALDALTQRPLLSTMMPDSEWVDVKFETTAGETHIVRFDWKPERFPQQLLDELHLKVPLGIDVQTDAVSELRKEKYGRCNAKRKELQYWGAEDEARGELKEPVKLSDFHIETHMPWAFRAHRTRDDLYGYIRLYKFKTRNALNYAKEFARLTSLLPDRGLIIDARGNPGGNIQAAECTLQVLSEKEIRPLRADFTTSPLLLEICKANAKRQRLGQWVESLTDAVATGSTFSRGFALTPTAMLKKVKERYLGPAVLIVDAHCYSAMDMFAAGFIDHKLGKVLGTANNTGAGGANVWRHSDLLRLSNKIKDTPLRRLPSGIDFRVAVRRTTRVNDLEGQILEDRGIEIDMRHYMTRSDVFDGNRDLIAAATRLLG